MGVVLGSVIECRCDIIGHVALDVERHHHRKFGPLKQPANLYLEVQGAYGWLSNCSIIWHQVCRGTIILTITHITGF